MLPLSMICFPKDPSILSIKPRLRCSIKPFKILGSESIRYACATLYSLSQANMYIPVDFSVRRDWIRMDGR